MTQTLESTTNLKSATKTSLTWWQVIGIGAAASAVVNLVVLAIGGAFGATYDYVNAGEPGQVTVIGVIVSSVVPLVIGTGLAAVIGRRWHTVLRIAQVVGAALAVLSVAGPLSLGTDTVTQGALTVMHLVLGVAVVAVLEAIRRAAK